MAGLYFHIPFCKSICTYCDFYKTSQLTYIEPFVETIIRELKMQNEYLHSNTINTLYFGGGTPSVLQPHHFDSILDACKTLYNIANTAEITIEANPDDLSPAYLKKLLKTGFNRLSIGIQSLHNSDLQFMGRRHTAQQALIAVKDAQNAGFSNISIDLIYGVPGMDNHKWKQNLEQIFELNIQHISAYHLTYHKHTKLWNDLKAKRFSEIPETKSLQQFEMLIDMAMDNQFIQYEISNFAKNEYFSRHNSSYWKQTEYLGLGPSAHSFNTKTRQWNVSNLNEYIEQIKNNKIPALTENLTVDEQFNDYVITSLRTIWGIDMLLVKNNFGEKYFCHLEKMVDKYRKSQYIAVDKHAVTLTRAGMFVSDTVLSDFIV